jgi:hypothetical protein
MVSLVFSHHCDVECLRTCFLVICLLWRNIYLYPLPIFWWFVFLHQIVRVLFCTLDTSPLPDKWIENIFFVSSHPYLLGFWYYLRSKPFLDKCHVARMSDGLFDVVWQLVLTFFVRTTTINFSDNTMSLVPLCLRKRKMKLWELSNFLSDPTRKWQHMQINPNFSPLSISPLILVWMRSVLWTNRCSIHL